MSAKIVAKDMSLEQILGTVRDGKLYRLTARNGDQLQIGLVRAKVEKPRFEVIPGHVSFIIEGETLNESPLYPSMVDSIDSIEEVDESTR